MIGSTTASLALLHFVRTVVAIIVLVAHPHGWYAFVILALELRGWTRDWRTVQLVLAKRTIGHLVAAHIQRNATRGNRIVPFTSVHFNSLGNYSISDD